MANLEYVYKSSFLVKRGFAADWAELNPVLRQGEIGFIIDENAIKIGDGVTLWNELPVVGDDEFGKIENKIREELEKGWKKPVRFNKSVAIGSAEASGNGSFAMGRYWPISIEGDDISYSEYDKCEIRRLTEEEKKEIYEYTGIYYEYITRNQFNDRQRDNIGYFIDIDQMVHTTDFEYFDFIYSSEDSVESCNVFNIIDGETIDVDYDGPVVWIYPSECYCQDCSIRQLTNEEQNKILEETGTIYQYVDSYNNISNNQNMIISRPIVEKTIHIIESEYISLDRSEDGFHLRGDVFNIADGETIEVPYIGFSRGFIDGESDFTSEIYIRKLTDKAKELVYKECGTYYEYIEIYDCISDDSTPTIELYNIEKYGNVIDKCERDTSLGTVFNLVDNTGFEVPYEGEMHFKFLSPDWALNKEDYEPTAVASGNIAFAQGDYAVASGSYSHAEGRYTKASSWASHAEGYRTEASGSYSHAEGDNTKAFGVASHAEGYNTTASAEYTHAEGYGTQAISRYTHTEGYSTYALNQASHAEGYDTEATGHYSHAEGQYTKATSSSAHAEGYWSEAKGQASHAEGSNTKASGLYSHAEGKYTIASGEAQHAQGKYNIEDTENKHAFIIGNGSSNSERSNAFTVDWNGDTKMAGWLDTQGLRGNTLTRNLYVGGAKNIDGNWEPRNPFIVDYAEKYSVKNQAYVSTMEVPKEGTYWLTAPYGSNYIYKISITTKKGLFTAFDVNLLPTSTAGQYGNYYEYNSGNFVAVFGNKTRVDSSSKQFPDGTWCYKRFNMQNGLSYYDNNLDMPYPAIRFDTSGAATVKVWWVAGDANRPLVIQTDENGGSSRLEVSGTFVAHGNAEFNKTAYFDNNVDIHGRLETKDVHVDGFIETTESIKCGGNMEIDGEVRIKGDLDLKEDGNENRGNIKNVQALDVYGTATFENDVKIKNNSNRRHTVKLRDALHEALDFDFKKRIPFNADELLDFANYNNLKEQIEVMREISATTLTLNEEEYTFEIGDEPIEIWKDLTLKGISEKPVVINFNYTGTADEFTVFKVMAPDLKISFENLVINSERVNGGYGRRYFIKCDENAINSNLLLNKVELQEDTKINIYQGNSIYLKESKTEPDTWSGSVKNFYVFDDKKEFAQYYEKLTDYINITDNYQGYHSSTEGANCSATGASHAEGVRTIANPEPWLSEGEPYVIGGAHAEGYETQALATPSHSEGYCTVANGDGSHAEGGHTVASGEYSHAEGWNTQSNGQYSHAEGRHTKADGISQHVQGKFNIEDAESKYAHIVGNGSNSERSNSHTLDWDGNAWYAGDVYVGSTSGVNRDEGSKKLATEEFVNTAIQQNAYTLPAATTETIGGVKVGNSLEISADGALNVKQAETPTELYLMSPGGIKFKITVSDVGALLAEQVV